MIEFDTDDPAQAMIAELRASNQARVDAFRAEGRLIQEDRTAVVVEFLLDLVGGNSPPRLEFERLHAQRRADQLDAIDKQIAIDKLMNGVHVAPPGLRSVQQ